MRLLNPFKAFSSSSQDAQSGGEADIALQPSLPIGSSRKRRRLQRRATTRPAGESQPEHNEHVTTFKASTPVTHEGFWSAPSLLTEVSRPVDTTRSRISSPIPTCDDESSRSTPNFLTDSESSRQADDAQQQTWRSMPALQRQSASMLDYGHFQENISDGDSWRGDVYSTYSDGDVQPPFDPERTTDSPVFGPRMEGLFRNEMPYDMDSPLSRLASGWRDTSPRVSRPLPDPPISVSNEEHPHNQSVTYPHDPTETNSRAHPQQEYRRPRSAGSAHGTYYIVPGGMSLLLVPIVLEKESATLAEGDGERTEYLPSSSKTKMGMNYTGVAQSG
ncbi:hypothetical protein GGX14DRAFT_385131 [Mycena pura]|uniref:Uncharacterized protein n=1 Tax=Mycena pura TaxID=153505 RepID=A0AAD6YTB9_9AGAR|nr:hypothetical protein GGX14DRAFT_385131 [Mycena pura]